MNKLQILERLKSQGVDRSVWPFFLLRFPSVFSLCNTWHISSVPLPWYGRRNCEIIIMITLKAIALFFQAVARVNSVGYNSTLFCWYLANFGKLLKSVNDVNMTRTMSHDQNKRLWNCCASCSICNVLLNRCTTKWNPFVSEKEGRGKNRRLRNVSSYFFFQLARI